MGKNEVFWDALQSEIINWISQDIWPLLTNAAYGFGIVTGLIIFGLIIVPVFDKFMTYFTYRDEISVFGSAESLPNLSSKQKGLLKEILFWWNKQCDSWYITKPSAVDDLLDGVPRQHKLDR